LHRKARTDSVAASGGAPRSSARDLRLNPLPKVNRIRLSHPCWPPYPASILNQTSDSLGIPFDSYFTLDALDVAHALGGDGVADALGDEGLGNVTQDDPAGRAMVHGTRRENQHGDVLAHRGAVLLLGQTQDADGAGVEDPPRADRHRLAVLAGQ